MGKDILELPAQLLGSLTRDDSSLPGAVWGYNPREVVRKETSSSEKIITSMSFLEINPKEIIMNIQN